MKEKCTTYKQIKEKLNKVTRIKDEKEKRLNSGQEKSLVGTIVD